MASSARANEIKAQVEGVTRAGDLKRLAKELGTDHELAMELWASGQLPARRLAVLILDKARLTQELVDRLARDAEEHEHGDRVGLFDWLMANQLMKSAGGKALLSSWEASASPLQRRLFWYYQARLRWTGQAPPRNTEALLEALERGLAEEVPEVQWAMNFTAGQIGTYQPEHRARCIALGERTGVYRDEVVPAGCTPNYLPDFIRIQVDKLAS